MTIRFCISFFILLLSTSDMYAQPDTDIFQYRYVGPTRGGRVTAVAGITSQPSTFYMGATGGGLWKTDDYGVTWKNSSDGYFSTPSIGAIRVAQDNPNIVYVGTGSDGLRSNVITGKGIYKSTDAGEKWTHLGLDKIGQVGAIEIHPEDNNTVFVAAIGQAFQPNPERGVYRTKDGGTSWEKVLFISDTTGIADVEFMPTNPNTIYASAWRAERKPWTIISGGDESGIYKSTDGGTTWNKVGNGLPSLMGKIDLAVSPAAPNVLYALVEAPTKESGLYRSDDNGANFVHISNEQGLTDRPFYYCNVDADPSNADIVYVNSTRFYKSENGGKKWNRVRTPHGDNHDMWINPNDSQLFIQGNDGGANVTHNGGKTWSSQMNQPTAELYQVEVDNQYPYWLYAGQQDNSSTISVPSAPPYGNAAGGIGYIAHTGGCETGPAVPNPDNPDIVYSNCKGRFSVYNKKTGQDKKYDVGTRFMYGHNPRDLKFRFQRVSPIHISPHDSKVIYHGSQYVHRTTDEGKTWETISPDLTAFESDKQVRSGSPITNDITGEEFYSTIYSIQESKISKGLIWVGANDGPVHVTKDGGKNWKNVTPKSLKKGGRVDSVEPSPHNPSKAYFTVLRYQLGDWKPYIFKTTNYGEKWELLTNGRNGIPDDYPVRVMREDPIVAGLLYAGTDFGMFISFDDGKNWQSFQQNLPVTPITDIKIHRDDLVLSTMGRGFQIVDGISSLRQNFKEISSEIVHLFHPGETVRYRYRPSGVGSEVNHNYPASGVIIDYYLPENVVGDLSLEITDMQGNIVRTFKSTANKTIEKKIPAVKEMKKKDMEVKRDMATEEVSYTVSGRLAKTKGTHRFLWDMKHTGAWDKNAKRAYGGGPLVAPGRYKINLKAGDDTYTQTCDIKADPRVIESGVSLDDLKEQEKLLLQVIDLYSEAKKYAHENEKLIKDGKMNEATKAKLQPKVDALVQKKGRYTQPMLIAQIRYLYGSINSADLAPSKDTYARYAELVNELKNLKSK